MANTGVANNGSALAGATIAFERQQVVALLEANDRESAARLAGDLGLDLVFGDANSDFHVAWLSRLPVRRAGWQPPPSSSPAVSQKFCPVMPELPNRV